MIQPDKPVIDYATPQGLLHGSGVWFCLFYLTGSFLGAIPSFVLFGWKCYPIQPGEEILMAVTWLSVTAIVMMLFAREKLLHLPAKAIRLGLYSGALSWTPGFLISYSIVFASGWYVISWP